MKNDFIIIFDDLERSSLWSESSRDLLGVINYYVETKGFRVIVICHEGKVPVDFSEEKEKVIGRTITVIPDRESAFNSFVKEFPDSDREFFIENKGLILDIWGSSKNNSNSLRVLRYVLLDLKRLKGLFFSELLEKPDVLREVLIYFAVVFIEFYSGNLKSFGINKISDDWKRSIEGFGEEYSLFKDLSNLFDSNEILSKMLFEAVFDERSFKSAVTQRPEFSKGNVQYSWKNLVNFDELSDSETDLAYRESERILDSGEVGNIGVFLHVAAMRLLIASKMNGEDGSSLEKERDKLLGAIEGIFGKSTFELIPKENNPFINESYGGYAYWETEETKLFFNEVRDEAFVVQDRLRQKREEGRVQDCVSDMTRDPDAWFRSFIESLGDGIPLEKIPARVFVNSWLKVSDRKAWLRISMVASRVIRSRYEGLDADRKGWVKEVLSEINIRAGEARKKLAHQPEVAVLAEYRIKRLGKLLKRGSGLSDDQR